MADYSQLDRTKLPAGTVLRNTKHVNNVIYLMRAERQCLRISYGAWGEGIDTRWPISPDDPDLEVIWAPPGAARLEPESIPVPTAAQVKQERNRIQLMPDGDDELATMLWPESRDEY